MQVDASYSTSFQPTSGTAQDGSYFKPTEGEQYEAGIKYEPPGYKSFITLSVYDLTQKNVTTTDPTNPSFQVQTGEQRSRGVELEGKVELAQGPDLIASYAYTDAEVTKANTVGTGATAYSLEGSVPISVPKDTASLWLDYTVQGGPMEGLGVGQRYVGSSYNAKNTVKATHYTLTDASVRYDLAHLSEDLQGVSVDLSASNLFDKHYFTLENDQLLGGAALASNDLPERPELGPWRACVFIAPQAGRRGLAEQLIEGICDAAKANGTTRLYLHTYDRSDYYAKRGWQVQEFFQDWGREQRLMLRDL